MTPTRFFGSVVFLFGVASALAQTNPASPTLSPTPAVTPAETVPASSSPTPGAAPMSPVNDVVTLRETRHRLDQVAADQKLLPSNFLTAKLLEQGRLLGEASAKGDKAAISAGLQNLEQIWSQAVARHDSNVIARLEASDFVCTDPNGVVTGKAEDLRVASSGAFQLINFKLSDVKVDLYGDTAVLTGRTTYSGTVGDQAIGGDFRWTDVFVRRTGDWQVVASQATNVAPPADK